MWNVFDRAEYRAAFFVCVLTSPICILATALRFVTTRRSSRKLGIEDWFALLALLAYLTYTIMLLWIVIKMEGKSVFQAGTLPPPTVLAIYKVGYVMNTMFPSNQTFAKLSLLALYYRFFSINKAFVRWVWGIAITHFCWFMAMFWIRWFMCTPVAKVWNPALPGHCIDSNMLLAVGEAFNSVFDFIMVALAIWVVRSLKVSRATRWKLSILFALGGLSGVIGFIKIGEAYGGVGANILNAVWDEVQMAVSIVCCCAPIYRSMVLDFPVIRSIWSKTWLAGSSKRTSEKGSGGGRLPRAVRTFGQGSRSRGHGREPDASLMEESQKGWASDDWYPLGSGSGEVRVGAGPLPYQYGQPTADSTPAYPVPVQGVHVYRTVDVV